VRVRGSRLTAALLMSGLGGCASVPGPPIAGMPLTRADVTLSPELGSRQRLRLLLVGDTGDEGAPRDAVVRSIAAEGADVVVILGDLVYPHGPSCEGGRITDEARGTLEQHLGRPFGDLRSPVLLVLGNHDVERRILWVFKRAQVSQEACYFLYASEGANPFVLPARHYSLTLGPAALAVVTSTGGFLDADAGRMTSDVFGRRDDDWDILLTHHVYRTFYEMEGERAVRDWLQRERLRPDVVANGHAHFLQMGVYDGVLAITSGGGARKHRQKPCAVGAPPPQHCRAGEYFGHSGGYGYVLLELEAETATVAFKDENGRTLWGCVARRRERSCSAR
jgi:predicted phosphodiesterase